MAVREVKDQLVVNLDPHKEFSLSLPRRFFASEPDRDKVLELWGKFRSTVNKLCRTRTSILSNRYSRKAVFNSAMENLCADFSRRTENIKIQFEELPDRKTYRLLLLKLSQIPAEVRNAGRQILAEIPEQEVEATEPAEFLAYGGGDQQISVPAEVLYEPSTTFTSYLRTNYQQREAVLAQARVENVPAAATDRVEGNPPMAHEVVPFASTTDALAGRRSALERMQELESIKGYLSAAEYTEKRQAILDSV